MAEKLVNLITLSYCIYLNGKGCQWSVNDRQGECEVDANDWGLNCVSCLEGYDILSEALRLGHLHPDTLGSVHLLFCIPKTVD